ncbi:uncharacterized protein LOC111040082 [Myzus persicae]|uniref:uncharacterized protein LOC111040082 n=1 Tax=Myzus persicae TaxID=13164 RepID=UPI000B938E7D|nr:uncharacterized protein LOC111040082 [Myzus persicae]
MNSNNNAYQRKTLLRWYEKKTFLNQKDKNKSYTLKKTNKIATVSNNEFDNEVKKYSTANSTKTNDKQDDFIQTLEFKDECQIQERAKMSSLNTRYELNFKNYIQELHNALIKECSYNLLDLNSLNLTLDFESLTSVTNRTLKAIKVL